MTSPTGAGAPAVAPKQPGPEELPPVERPVVPSANDFLKDSRTSVVALGALELLASHCGDCHANGSSEGGLGDVLDLEKLIANGWLVPGSSATSPLFASILVGSMPPDGAREQLISGEVTVIARFIDELRAVPAPPCQALPFMGSDEVYARMAADIAQQPPADRPFIRYLGLTYASNAGSCGAALERQRLALFKQLNSVSTATEIARPAPIDDRELLYRIDLRDYGWDREIDLLDDDSAIFADGWLAIAASVGAYAVEFEGLDANALKDATGTAVPFLPANAFVHFSTSGELYYALIGARANVYDVLLALGIDLEALFYDLELLRAGFTDREPYREAVVYRAAQGSLEDRFYWSLDNEMGIRGSTIFDDPAGYAEAGEHAIFHLPNGLPAFLVASDNGARIADVPASCTARECDLLHRSSIGECQGCHAGGLLPVVDRVRDVVEANVRNYEQGTLEAVQTVYPTPSEFAELQLRDNEIYLSALERAGVPRDAPDPVSRVFLEFAREELDFTRVAAELGVGARPFANALPRLDPSFTALGSAGGTIDRDTLSSAFHASQCVLHAEAANRPVSCP